MTIWEAGCDLFDVSKGTFRYDIATETRIIENVTETVKAGWNITSKHTLLFCDLNLDIGNTSKIRMDELMLLEGEKAVIDAFFSYEADATVKISNKYYESKKFLTSGNYEGAYYG